jgi:hypothetical protein
LKGEILLHIGACMDFFESKRLVYALLVKLLGGLYCIYYGERMMIPMNLLGFVDMARLRQKTDF